jgi:YVTN family beta-propeller protein
MRVLIAVLVLLALIATTAHAEQSPLVVERTIKLADVRGRIDHMAIDLGRKRLFVAELGNGTVDVIDLTVRTVINRIEGLKEPQGVAYAPAADVLAVASAGDGSVRLFRGAKLSPAGTINLGDDADNVRLDARTGYLVVGYGGGGLAMIDPASASLVGRIPLRAHPEGFQLNSEKRRAFVNVPDARQIAVIDMVAGRQIGTWQIPDDLRANFPLAMMSFSTQSAAALRELRRRRNGCLAARQVFRAPLGAIQDGPGRSHLALRARTRS